MVRFLLVGISQSLNIRMIFAVDGLAGEGEFHKFFERHLRPDWFAVDRFWTLGIL
jgi:hypothetical protein